MTEYTSLKVSRRLADAGFKEDPDMGVYGCGGDVYFPITNAVDWSHATHAYRHDTLLDWLMHKPLFSLRTHTVHVEGQGVRRVDTGVYELRLFVTATLGSGKTLEGDAPTLPDALAEVVMQVLEVSK